MYPIALQIGNFTIRWYGVMAAVGFLAAAFFINRNRKEANLTSDQAANLVFIAMTAGVIGSRIFYVVQFASQFRNNWVDIFRIDKGGLVFYGGLILAVICILIYCKMCKLDIIKVFDVFTPAMPFAHACGRIGCFLNGCCFGTMTDSWVGVKYPAYSEPYMRYPDAALHPVQLYEAAFNFILCGVMIYLVRKVRYKGVPMGFYFIAYGFMRIIFEFFRGDNAKIAGFTIAQYIGVGLIIAGIIIVVFGFKRKILPIYAEEEKA